MKESSLETDPYATTIRIKNKIFDNFITAGHIPRERSQHVHFFVITKGKKVNEHVKWLMCRQSAIPSWVLKVPLKLKSTCQQKKILGIRAS